MALKLALISAIVALVSSVASGLVISSDKLTHNEAVMFCASNGGRLADVTSANRDQVNMELMGHSAWIGSWDYNYYTGQCMNYHNGHIGAVSCEEKHFAACNIRCFTNRLLNMLKKSLVLVLPVVTSPAPSPSLNPPQSYSDAGCYRDCAVPNCGYQYVYMTRYVDQVYTSVDVTTATTSTTTLLNYFATVAAYTITRNFLKVAWIVICVCAYSS